MVVAVNASSAALYTAAMLFLSWSTPADAAKLPKCAKECIVPSICTKADFCSTTCFGNCLVPPSLNAPAGCSSAMDQQLLLKACKGAFDTEEKAESDGIAPRTSRVSTSTVGTALPAAATALSASVDTEAKEKTDEPYMGTPSTRGAAYSLYSASHTRPRILIDDEEEALAESSSSARHVMKESIVSIGVVALLFSASACIV